MTIGFTINGTLPTMNEIVEVSKKHWSGYSRMKKTYTSLVAWSAKSVPKLQKVDVVITWYCKNKRQDKDNIMAGQKFIFDGLVTAGKLDNDGWGQIRSVTHLFEVDKAYPRIEIELREQI